MEMLWHQRIQRPQEILSTTRRTSNQIQPVPVFCTACARRFPDKRSLEDHACPAASFICTCGMGFTEYQVMRYHRNGHSDTNSLQSDCVSIVKQSVRDARLREMKLRMLRSIDRREMRMRLRMELRMLRSVDRKQQKLRPAQNPSLSMAFTALRKPTPPVTHAFANVLRLAAHTSTHVSPVTIPITSPVSSLTSVTPSNSSSKSIPYTALPMQPRGPVVSKPGGATVNLNGKFQPVVLLRTNRKFPAGARHMCATCRAVFRDKLRLMEHVASHSFTYVSGCLRCGLLLLAPTPPSNRHHCGVYYASRRERFTTGSFIGDVAGSFIGNVAGSFIGDVAGSFIGNVAGCFIGDVADQKQENVLRCPHCAVTYNQPWRLNRHLRLEHLSRNVLCSPPTVMNKGITEFITQKAVASGTRRQVIRKSQEPEEKKTEVLGMKVINGLVKRTVPQPDGKGLQRTVEDVMRTGGKEPEALLEMITRVTGGSVAEGRRHRLVAAQGLEDLKQERREVETETEKCTLNPLRCVICGEILRTAQMLGQHWCKRKVTLLRQEKLQSRDLKFKDGYRGSLSRSAPCSMAERDLDGMVTLQLQTSHYTEIGEPVLKNMKVKPTELSCTGLLKTVAVQTKAEFDDGSYDAAINHSITSHFPTNV